MTKPLYKPKTPSPLNRTITSTQLDKTIVKNTLQNSYNPESVKLTIHARVPKKDYVRVSDRNELIKNIIEDLEQKFLSERAEQAQKDAELALSKNDNTSDQALSGEVSLKCEEESLDDWF